MYSKFWNLKEALEAEAEVTAIIQCEQSFGGAVDLTITGGVDPYTVRWSIGGASLAEFDDLTSLSDLGPGTYDYEVTDDNACTVSGSATITDPTQDPDFVVILNWQSYTSTYNNDITCGATIYANPTGGTPPYTYEWSNSAFSLDNYTNEIRPTPPITVIVTDARGCTVEETIQIGPCNGNGLPGNDDGTLLVLPNPNPGVFTARVDINNSSTTLLYVKDMVGNVLQQEDLGLLAPGQYDVPFDISMEAPGPYFVQAVFNGGAPYTFLMTKQ